MSVNPVLAVVAALASNPAYRQHEFEHLGVSLKTYLPVTNVEVDRLCGEENSAAKLAVRQVFAHSFLGNFREDTCDALEQLFKDGFLKEEDAKNEAGEVVEEGNKYLILDNPVPEDKLADALRKTKPTRAAKEGEKPEDVPVEYVEKPKAYADRVRAAGYISNEQFAALVIYQNDHRTFDMKAKERTPGSTKIAKMYFEGADALLNDPDDQRAHRAVNMLKKDFNYTVDIDEETGRPNRESLAKGLKVREDAKRQKVGADIE